MEQGRKEVAATILPTTALDDDERYTFCYATLWKNARIYPGQLDRLDIYGSAIWPRWYSTICRTLKVESFDSCW
jgi:hypothetical protein